MKHGDHQRRWPGLAIKLLLVAAAAVLIVRADLREAGQAVTRQPTLAELKDLFGADASPHRLTEPIIHYQAGDAAAVSTTDLPPVVKGYAGQINCLVEVEPTGKVKSVKVIAQHETPAYWRKVVDAGFLDRLKGLDLKRGGAGIDAVTGASITSRAILDDTVAAGTIAADKLYGLSLPAPAVPTWGAALLAPRLIAVMVTLLAVLYARFGKWRKREAATLARLLALLVIGVWAMTPYTLVHTFQLLRLHLPGPANALLAVLAGFVIVTTLLFGPLWCSYACPFGALQEFLARLPVRRWKVTPSLIGRARWLRWAVLFAAVAGFFGAGVEAMARIEPFGHLFARTREPLAWVFIVTVLAASVFVKRFWCRFFCPTGACLVLLSSHRRLLKSVERGLHDSGIDRADEEDASAQPTNEEQDGNGPA